MAHETVEQALLREYTALIDDRLGRNIDFLATGAFDSHEQAREIVGYIRALREAKQDFSRLIKAYFPST